MQEDSVFQNVLLRDAEIIFKPNADLTDKCNYTRHVFIEEDGSVSEVVRLNVWDDRHREDIIGFHFSKQYAKMHYCEKTEQPQFYVVGRDNPWDFEYVMHDGTTFFVEVCRVADRDLLRVMKAENDVSQLLLKDELTSHEIKKIERLFPGTLPNELVEAAKSNKKGKFTHYNSVGAPKLFLRPPMNPRVDLKLELETALTKKAKKTIARKKTQSLC